MATEQGDIQVLVGVQGDSSFSKGSSGALIVSQLQDICKKISETKTKQPKVVVGIDIKNTTALMTKQLNEVASKIILKLKTSVNDETITGDGTKRAYNRNMSQKQKERNEERKQIEIKRQHVKVQKELNKLMRQRADVTVPEAIDLIKDKDPKLDTLTKYFYAMQEVLKSMSTDKVFSTAQQQQLQGYAEALNAVNEAMAQHKADVSTPQIAKEEMAWDKVILKAQDYRNKISATLSRDPAMQGLLDNFIENAQSRSGFDTAGQAMTYFLNLQTQIRAAGLEVETFGQKMKRMFSTKIGYGFVTAALMAIRRAAREAVQEVVELDAKFAELRIVSGQSAKEIKQTAKEIYSSAQQTKTSIAELTDAVTVYNRLGFDTATSIKLAEYTNVYSKVADVEIADAEANITAIVKAYDKGADEIEHVLDTLIGVGRKYAISSAEIGEGLNNAASALVAGGNSFEKSVALLAAAQTTTQDISKSSTALRTITARIRNTSAELHELGEELDDEYNTVSKYRDQLLGLTGVDILDANGNYKDTYDILKELSDVWATLNDREQATVTNMLAGTRQINVFSSLMQNFSEAEAALRTALGSQGEYANAFEIYADTINAKLTETKNISTEIAQQVLNSDVLKGALDVINALLGSVNHNLLATVTLVGSLIGLFKAKSIIKVATSIKDTFTGANSSITEFGNKLSAQIALWSGNADAVKDLSVYTTTYKKVRDDMIAATGEAEKAISAETMKTIEDTAATQANTAAKQAAHTATLQFALGMVAAGMAVVSIVSNVVDAIKRAEEERVRLSIEAAKQSSDELKTVNELVESYQKLADAKKENGGTWDTTQINEVKNIQARITELVGAQAQGLDLVNGKLDEEYEKLKVINAETAKTAYGDAVAELQKLLRGKAFNQAFQADRYRATVGNDPYDIIYTAYQKAKDADMLSNLPVIEKSIKTDYIGLSNSERMQWYDEVQRLYNELVIHGDTGTLTMRLSEFINSNAEEYNQLHTALQHLSTAVQSLSAYGIEDVDIAGLLQSLGLDESFLTSASGSATGGKSPIDAAVWSIGNYKDAIDDLQTKMQGLRSALDSLNKGDITIDDVMDLLQDYPSLWDKIDLSDDKFGRLEEGLKGLLDAAPTALIEQLEKLREQFKDKSTITQINQVIDALRRLGESSGNAAERLKELNAEAEELEDQLKKLYVDVLEDQKDKLDGAAAAVADVIDAEIDRLKSEKEALQQNNTEREKAIQLLELEEARRKALTNKDKRVWYADRGWVWETDANAIKQATDALEDFKREQDIAAIDDQIADLEEYKSKWTSVGDEITAAQNKVYAAELFGADWEKEILADRITNLENFRTQYVDLMSQIKQAQLDASGGTNQEQYDKYLEQLFNNRVEAAKLTEYGQAREKAAALAQELDEAEMQVIRAQNKVKSIEEKSAEDPRGKSAKAAHLEAARAELAAAMATAEEIRKRYVAQMNSVNKYATGTTSARGGLSVVDEHGTELILHNPHAGRYAFLEHGDGVIPANLTERLMNFARSPRAFLSSIAGLPWQYTGGNGGAVLGDSIYINNIEMNGVNDVEALVRELKQRSKNR